MNCPNCNFPNEPNAPFCVNCGAALPAGGKSVEMSQTADGVPVVSTKQPAGPTAQPQQPAVPGPYEQQPQTPTAGYGQQPPVIGQPQTGAAVAAGMPAGQQPQPLQAASYQAQAPAHVAPASMAAQPQIQAEVKKKQGKGCIIAVVIIGALALIAVIVFLLFMFLGYFTLKDVAEKKEAAVIEKRLEEEKQAELEAEQAEEKEKISSKIKKKDEASTPPDTAKENPLIAKTPKDELYQSQVFMQNDKIKYAGATFSVKSEVDIYKGTALPSGLSVKKGEVMADVEIAVFGKTKLKKFKISLYDGEGKKHIPNTPIEKAMELPDREGEIHKLWRKTSKISKNKTFHLHRGFSIPEESAENFIVEILNVNIDRALWIKVKHKIHAK